MHGLELYPQCLHNCFLTVERTLVGMFLKRQAQRHLEAGLGLGQWGLYKGQFWEGNKRGKTGEPLCCLRGMDTVGVSVILCASQEAVLVLRPCSLAFLRLWCCAATTHKEGPTLAHLFLFDLRIFQRIRVLEIIGLRGFGHQN